MSPKAKAAMTTIALAAVERLSDPAVRAKLMEQTRHLADQVKEWQKQRTSDPTRKRSRRLRRLDERASSLRSTMDRFASQRPEVADALLGPRAVLDEVDVALEVAADLPKDKRRQAARRIADELDRLEQTALDIAIPDGTRGGSSA